VSEKPLSEQIDEVREIVRARLVELGIENKLPTVGVFRIIHDVMIDYWGDSDDQEDEEEEQDEAEYYRHLSESTLSMEMGRGRFRGKMEIYITAKSGERSALALVDPEDGYMYIPHHRVKADACGKLHANHRGGEECKDLLVCRKCEKNEVRLMEDGGEYYMQCQACRASTAFYPNPYLAILAWLIGKTEAEQSTW
jgi:hypothetical protein